MPKRRYTTEQILVSIAAVVLLSSLTYILFNAINAL